MTLTEYIAAWPRRFDWANFHCAHFALGWVQAATGRPALAAIPDVQTLRAWVRAVADEGGMGQMVSQRLRCDPVPIEQAQPGDLLQFLGNVTGGALGIRLHVGAAVLGDGGRVVVVNHAHAVRAWPLQQILPEAA